MVLWLLIFITSGLRWSNSRRVRDAIRSFLSVSNPLMISYSYTKLFQKRIVEDLNFNVGYKNLQCQCSTSNLRTCGTCYVITGNLTI